MGQHDDSARPRIIGYVRVSRPSQAEHGYSLEAQEAALRAYCEARGLDLVELAIDPAVTSSVPLGRREGGRRVLDAVASGAVAGVAAVRLDRLFRDCRETLERVDAWERQGVALHLLDLGGQSLDTSTAMGRFFLTVMAGAAELERGLISERISETKAALRDAGLCSGSLRLGERRGETDSRGRARLETDPAETETVARIETLRAAGATLRSICATLQAEGRRPKRGSTWQPSSVRAVLRRAA